METYNKQHFFDTKQSTKHTTRFVENNIIFQKLNPLIEKDLNKYFEILLLQPKGYSIFNEKIDGDNITLNDKINQIIKDKNLCDNVTFQEWCYNKNFTEQNVKQSEIAKVIRENIPELMLCSYNKSAIIDKLYKEIKYASIDKFNTLGLYAIKDKTTLSKNNNPKTIGFIGIVPTECSNNIKVQEAELLLQLKEPYTGRGLGKIISERFGRENLISAYNNKYFEPKAMIKIETLQSNKSSQKMQNKIGINSKKDNQTNTEITENSNIVKYPVKNVVKLAKCINFKKKYCCR